MLLCLATGLALGGAAVRSADAAPPTTYRDEVLADDPVSYWRFNEASGTTFVDDKGANNGTYIGPVSLGQPGAIVSDPTNKSASFNGTSAALSVPDSSSLDASSAVSVEVWMKREKGGVPYQAVVGKPLNGQSKFENYSIWLNASNQVRAYFGNGTTYATAFSSVALDTNWHQVVATYDNATAKVYVDGVLRGSATSTVALTPNTSPLLGVRTVSNGTYYGGLLDELAVYTSVLPLARIQVHYQKAYADLTPPVVTLSAPANGASLPSSSVTFAGTAGSAAGDSSTVTVKVYSGSSATGNPAQTLTATRQGDNSYSVGTTVGNGQWTAQAEQQDASGNVGTSSANTFAVGSAPPVTTISSGPASPTNQTSASFSFSANEPSSTFACSLDGAAFTACSSPQSYSGLAAGNHTFQVRATDTAENTGPPATHAWTIDTTPPPAPSIDSTPPNPSASTGASFAFSDSEAGSTFECSLDGGQFSACSSPQTYSGLADGGHTFQVRAIDEVTNQSDATSFTWSIDATPPPVPTIHSRPPDPSSSTDATFTFSDSEPGATFTCSIDAEASAECTSPMSYSLLPEGSHTFEVRAADALGNVSGPATATWTIDLAAPPAPTIDSSPPDPSNSADASFTFSDSEPGVDFECGLDGATLSACTSPVAYSGLADGGHTFQVRASAGGNSFSAVTSYTWTIDTAAPITSIGTKPADPSNDPAPTFTFSASEPSTFECKLDDGNFSGCTSGIAYSGLAEGSHTFSVHARDSAGNTGADATYTWTLDTVAPPTPSLDSTPPTSSTSASASFAFSDAEPGVAFFCRLDGSAYTGCTSPSSFSGLADGAHSFDVKARDAVGNDSGVTSFTWTVDTAPPVTTISSGPPSLTNQTSAMFGFFATEGGVSECKLDGSSFSLCTSPTVYPVLTAGGHTFQVRTTDQAGNVGQPASYAWTIDTTAPVIVLTSPPNGGSSTNLPTFTGTAGTAANDSTTVTVKVYPGPSANGTPVQTLTTTAQAGGAYSVVAGSGLASGTYTARAEQLDGAGNLGLSSANTFSTTDAVLVAAGDIADCGLDGDEKTAALVSAIPEAVVAPLGDLVYDFGTVAAFNNCYHPTWGAFKNRTRPVVGDHEYTAPNQAPGFYTYFANQLAPFGAAAGDPVRGWYSYDLGSWHVAVVNTSCGSGAPAPACNETTQEQWLRADLAASSSSCQLVMYHSPRYSSGSIHGNDHSFAEVLGGRIRRGRRARIERKRARLRTVCANGLRREPRYDVRRARDHRGHRRREPLPGRDDQTQQRGAQPRHVRRPQADAALGGLRLAVHPRSREDVHRLGLGDVPRGAAAPASADPAGEGRKLERRQLGRLDHDQQAGGHAARRFDPRHLCLAERDQPQHRAPLRVDGRAEHGLHRRKQRPYPRLLPLRRPLRAVLVHLHDHRRSGSGPGGRPDLHLRGKREPDRRVGGAGERGELQERDRSVDYDRLHGQAARIRRRDQPIDVVHAAGPDDRAVRRQDDRPVQGVPRKRHPGADEQWSDRSADRHHPYLRSQPRDLDRDPATVSLRRDALYVERRWLGRACGHR